MTATPEADLKKLQDDFVQLRDDLSAFVKSLRGAAGAETDMLGDAKCRIAGIHGDIERTIVRGKEQIEKQPLMSTAASFAIGLLLGMAFSNRRQ